MFKKFSAFLLLGSSLIGLQGYAAAVNDELLPVPAPAHPVTSSLDGQWFVDFDALASGLKGQLQGAVSGLDVQEVSFDTSKHTFSIWGPEPAEDTPLATFPLRGSLGCTQYLDAEGNPITADSAGAYNDRGRKIITPAGTRTVGATPLYIDFMDQKVSVKIDVSTDTVKSINHASVKIVEAIQDQEAKVEAGCAASKKVVKSTKTQVTTYKLPGVDEPYDAVEEVLGETAVYTFNAIQYIRLDRARDHHGHAAFDTTIYHGSGTVTIMTEGDRRFCSGFQWIKHNSNNGYILDKETATEYAHLKNFLSGGNAFILPHTVQLLNIDASNPWKSLGKAVEAVGRGVRDAVKDLLK